MAILSRTRRTPGADRADAGGLVVDDDGRTSRYLTDGLNLFRYLGTGRSPMGVIVKLEDCRSMDIMLIPVGRLRAGTWRTVQPSAE
jgi:hypothetical protein